jgi:hypothetical protein
MPMRLPFVLFLKLAFGAIAPDIINPLKKLTIMACCIMYDVSYPWRTTASLDYCKIGLV